MIATSKVNEDGIQVTNRRKLLGLQNTRTHTDVIASPFIT